MQLARGLGAEVTGVCSTRHLALVRSIGASNVIDYTRQDFTDGKQHYDVIFDAIGNHSLRANDRTLAPTGVALIVGTSQGYEPWFGLLEGFTKPRLMAPLLHRRFVPLVADLSRTADLDTLSDLLRAGKVVPVIDRSYPLREVAAAFATSSKGTQAARSSSRSSEAALRA